MRKTKRNRHFLLVWFFLTRTVGPATWNRAISIFNAVARLNELDSQGVSLAEATTLFASNLRLGDHGFDVRALQYYLDFIGRFYPSVGRVIPDGAFGPQTDAALREFQRMNGLTVDGVAGRATHNALLTAYTELYNALTPEQARPIYPNYAFSQGDVIVQKNHTSPECLDYQGVQSWLFSFKC
ncbi:MAG: peptidoglycan-binding protein [Oscillospiraceae bacterium]|nr:peptidoglycan-binding protein [Oscillospiraceae bacterium]